MTKSIVLGVYRIQNLKHESLPKASKELVKLHNIRKEALHDIFDNQDIAKVISWGDTNDETSHEYVEIILSIIGSAIIQPVLSVALKKLGEKLVENAIDETTSEFVKWVIAKLTKKYKEKKLSDFSIRLNDKTLIQINAPQGKAEIRINFENGKATSIRYDIDN